MTEPIKEPAENVPTSVSRRDFLRRAGKDAVQSGVKLVPGVAIAQKALGIDVNPEKDKQVSAAPLTLLQRMAVWRDRRRKDGTA